MIPVTLNQNRCRVRILLAMKEVLGTGKALFADVIVSTNLIVRRQLQDRIGEISGLFPPWCPLLPVFLRIKMGATMLADRISGSGDVMNLFDLLPGLKAIDDPQQGFLTHAINGEIDTGIENQRTLDLFMPVIDMGHPPHRNFHTPCNDGNPLEGFPTTLGVHDSRSVRTQACAPSR